MRTQYDAAVIGSGPNGLAAAIYLAQQGLSVIVLEAAATLGGGARTGELTLPGFHHDICSAVHPLAVGSPFFRTLPLEQHGLSWVYPEINCAHPIDDSTCAVLIGDVKQTAAHLGIDADSYQQIMLPIVAQWNGLVDDLLAPFHLPRRLFPVLRFARFALQSASGLATRRFRRREARALVAGLAAHSMLPLDAPISAAVALVLAAAGHTAGWPFPRGGAKAITDSLAAYARTLSVVFETGRQICSLAEIPHARVVLLNFTPRQFLSIAGERLPSQYRRALEGYRYGPGAFKIDWALSEPVPFADERCRRAGTVHIGGTLEEIAESEQSVWNGKTPERPFVLFAQPSVFDSSRTPVGRHTAWAYCHVPNGSTEDMTTRIERRIERFAPGFRDTILARHAMTATDLEAHNANYVGGDINGGIQDIRQLFARPVSLIDPYRTPLDGVFLCSSSTPPGGGVHGMCGYHAARSALRYLAGR